MASSSIVVVAKCPIPGQSKTRLIPLTGEEGSSQLGTAMLADVLTSLTLLDMAGRSVDRILLYAPPNDEGRRIMEDLMDQHSIPRRRGGGGDAATSNDDDDDVVSESSKSTKSSHSRKSKTQTDTVAWTLLPMSNERIPETRTGKSHKASRRSTTTSSSNKNNKNKQNNINLKSTFLSDVLANSLQRARKRQRQFFQTNGPVLFVGMDAPELPLDEVQHALFVQPHAARLCPAADGGYGLLSVPAKAPAHAIFDTVRWSDPLTAVSQLKALTDNNVPVSLGRLMYDIDEPDDVRGLVKRLETKMNPCSGDDNNDDLNNNEESDEILTRPAPSTRRSVTGSCLFTRQALMDLDLWGCCLDENTTPRKPTTKLHIQTEPSGSTEVSSHDLLANEEEEEEEEDEEEEFALQNQLTESSSYTI